MNLLWISYLLLDCTMDPPWKFDIFRDLTIDSLAVSRKHHGLPICFTQRSGITEIITDLVFSVMISVMPLLWFHEFTIDTLSFSRFRLYLSWNHYLFREYTMNSCFQINFIFIIIREITINSLSVSFEFTICSQTHFKSNLFTLHYE